MPEPTEKDLADPAIQALFAHNARVRSRSGRSGSWLVLAPISFLLLVAGAAVALAAGAFSWTDDPTTTDARSRPPMPSSPAIGTAASSETTMAPSSTTTGFPPVIERTAPGRLHLSLRAVRGDSWVLVRAGDENGTVLYSGTIEKGSAANVSGTRLWIRFGSVGNLDLFLNGKPVRTLHSGTVNAIVTSSGLHS